MNNKCEFSDYPFCDNNCLFCVLTTTIRPKVEVLMDSIESKKRLNDIFCSKVKELVDARKNYDEGRGGLEVTKTSLYHLLKKLDKDMQLEIDFYVNGNWRFSSKGLGLSSVEECIKYLPDDLIVSNYEAVREGDYSRIRVNIE